MTMADQDQGWMTIRIPNLFVDIMAAECTPNPNYKAVRPEADAWLDYLYSGLDKSMPAAFKKYDLSYLSACWLPRGDAETLRLACDFNHWGFPWDDQFDEGRLQSDYMSAIFEVKKSMGILDDKQPPISLEENPYWHAYQNVWLRFKARTSADQQDRFRIRQRSYMLGCLAQTVWDASGSRKLNVDEYMEYRRVSIGVDSTFALLEALWGVDLPREVIEQPAVGACEAAMIDMLLLDLKYGTKHNIIVRLHHDQGLSLQESMDKAGQMLDGCFERWHKNRALIPKWDERTNEHVNLLLDVWRTMAVGALHWSFATGRYMGAEDGLKARTERLMKLPKVYSNGVSSNGVATNGTSTNGASINGTTTNGH